MTIAFWELFLPGYLLFGTYNCQALVHINIILFISLQLIILYHSDKYMHLVLKSAPTLLNLFCFGTVTCSVIKKSVINLGSAKKIVYVKKTNKR